MDFVETKSQTTLKELIDLLNEVNNLLKINIELSRSTWSKERIAQRAYDMIEEKIPASIGNDNFDILVQNLKVLRRRAKVTKKKNRK